jgi:LPS-assembly lipoprotein
MRRVTLKLLAVAGLAVLTGCGFQLRGQSPLPFDAAYVEAGAKEMRDSGREDKSTIAGLLRTQLVRQAKLATQRDDADVIIRLAKVTREKSILSLSGAGKVREYRLIHMVTVSAVAPDGREILAPAEIRLARDFSYSDDQVLAKEAEEAMLRRDMDEEALRQILRRLAFVRK